MLNDWFTTHYAGSQKPVLLCGDLNATPDSPSVQMLERCWNRLSPEDATYPSKDGGKCIDHILVLRDAAPVQVLSAQVYSRPKASPTIFPCWSASAYKIIFVSLGFTWTNYSS